MIALSEYPNDRTTTLGARAPIAEALLRDRVVAILRGGREAHLRTVCRTLIDTGVRCLEITTNTPGAWDAVQALHQEYGTQVELGVGTVREPGQVDLAAAAGAGFVVAPDFTLAVGERAAALGLGWYPGAGTPTEISTAWAAGASAVKVFPVSAFGGANYLRLVRAPLDDIPLLPTGGITVTDVPEYLRAGAIAVGMGSPLVGDALVTGETAPLAERARQLIELVRAAPPVG